MSFPNYNPNSTTGMPIQVNNINNSMHSPLIGGGNSPMLNGLPYNNLMLDEE